MFGLVVLINIGSLALNWNGGAKTAAIVSLAASIWAFGIAANFGRDRLSIPDYAATLSMISGLAGSVLGIIGIAS